MAHETEREIITAVIDLAASRREPINAYGDYDEWLTFESICAALEDVCRKLNIGRHTEQCCYQTLLRMSAESERHLTWWEKVEQLERYLQTAGKHGTPKLRHALPKPSPHLIRLVEPERTIHVRPTSVANMSAVTVREAEDLSMILNNTYGLQAAYGYSPRNTSFSTTNASMYHSNATPIKDGFKSTSSTSRRIHFNDTVESKHYQTWKAVDSKLSEIQNETHHVKEDISQLILSRSKMSSAATTLSTPESKGAAGLGRAADWTLSPSVILPAGSTVGVETPFAAAAPSDIADNVTAPAPAPEPRAPDHLGQASGPPSAPIAMEATVSSVHHKGKSKEFSDLLRQSGVMSKYLGISRIGGQGDAGSGGSPRSKARARSESPPRSAGAVSAAASKAAPPVASPPVSTAKTARKSMLDSPPQPTPPPQHHHHHHQSSNGTGASSLWSPEPDSPPAPPAGARTPSFPYTPSRVVPWVLQGHYGAGGVYTPEGHINVDALDFDPRTLNNTEFALNATEGALPPNHIPMEEQTIATITSTMRTLVLFHRWLLHRAERESHSLGTETRCAALVLAAHFSQVQDFVTSLFGLEQWLRDKMRLVVNTEAKALFWRRRRLHSGFENFLEYCMKRRMHRKNALHALAARRRHANMLHMAPVLRHRRARPGEGMPDDYADDGDQRDGDGDEEGTGAAAAGGSSVRDLSRLNKYSTLDMTMFHTERRQQQKRAQYLTSLSIRDIMHDVKAALLTYSRGSNNADGFRVKTAEYIQAQDTVALLFAFRRLYHRSIYVTRQRRVRARVVRNRLAGSFALWKSSWMTRTAVERAMEPQLVRMLQDMEVVKLRLALRKLHANIHVSRREKDALRRYAQRIRSKPLYLRALHSMRCLAYVKCFQALKQNYVSSSPSVAEQHRCDRHHAAYAQVQALRLWRRWYQQRSDTRRNGIRSEAGRRALMGLLLQRAHIWHVVQPSRHSTGTSMSTDTFFALPVVRSMHMTAALTARIVHQLQLRRALHRLRTVGQSTRVFFSLTEMRFAQALCRRSLPAERRKYMKLVNESSCRILPVSKGKTTTFFAQSRDVHFRAQDLYGGQALTRTTAEKPYKLIGIHPQSLRYYLRTVYNSTPLEHRENSDLHSSAEDSIRRNAEFIAPFLQKSIATLDGGVLCNTSQLLRTVRKWRVLCKDRGYLRRLANKVKHKRSLVLMRDVYDHWRRAYQEERQFHRSLKRWAMKQFHKLVARRRVLNRANSRTRRGVGHRHWQRLAAAHTHHTELRRLHAGHFYNSIMSGLSQRAVSFIAGHNFVPFSVRHFLTHYPSYRFPIYKRYDAAYWENSRQSAAYQALQVLCEHYHVYGHENHLAHHLEMFHHHHHEDFRPGDGVRRSQSDDHGELFPHSYASPALRVVNENTARRRGASSARPLHLTPGAMLSDQAFSVSAEIGNRYRRSAEKGGESSGRSGAFSPQKSRPGGSLSIETPYVNTQRSAVRTPASTAVRHETVMPAAAQLAAAAMFMSHWISECLRQYYALRRGLRILRAYAHSRAQNSRVLSRVFLAKKRAAFAVLFQNWRYRVLTKRIQLRRLRDFSRRMRVTVVAVRTRRALLRKVLQQMNLLYRYHLILRTWESAWRKQARSAWHTLLTFGLRRDERVRKVRALLARRIQADTFRTMCTTLTANMWRRRRDRIAGLRALVVHYNQRVQAMDREEVVRVYATVKHFVTLKANLWSSLKQRLSSVVGMTYRNRMALVRGFLAIAANVREPQRQYDENVLKDRVYNAIDELRRGHGNYHNHLFVSYGEPVGEESVVINTFNSFREKQLLRASSRYQHEFQRRGSFSPYVSSTLPMPSPMPSSRSIDTPTRRSSMFRGPAPPPRISHDMLNEGPGAAAEADENGNGPSAGMSTARSSVRSSSAALLFGSVRNSVSHSLQADRRSTVGSGTPGPAAPAAVAEREGMAATMAAMAARRSSNLTAAASLKADSADSLQSIDVDLVSVGSMAPSARGGSRGGVPMPRYVNSPYLPRSRRASTGDVDTVTGRGGAGASQTRQSVSRFSVNSSITASLQGARTRPSSRMDRRQSLHDLHADVVNTPTTALPALKTDLPAPAAGAPSRAPSRLNSILVTSPAYTGLPRVHSRGDSRIFFRDTGDDGPAAAAVGDSIPRPRRSSTSQSVVRGGVDALGPVSPLTQPTEPDGDARSMNSFFVDDNSTEVSTMRDTDSVRAGGYARVQRRRSFVHALRSEETAENLQVLKRGMLRGLWSKWRRDLVFRQKMRLFCARYLAERTMRMGLLVMRQQTALDRQQRLKLQRLDKRRAVARLSAHALRMDEGRQVADFADKYYVVMAMKLTLRRWNARAKESNVSSMRLQTAREFSKKRRCTLFLLNLRATSVPLALTEPSVITSPERKVRAPSATGSHRSHQAKSVAPKGGTLVRQTGSGEARRKAKTAQEDSDSEGEDGDGPADEAPKHKAMMTPAALRAMLRK